jgi:hypothetical protein
VEDVKSVAKSVTASQIHKNEIMKQSFPMKHHLDYPDYNLNDAEASRFWPTNKDKQLPEPKMNYVIELLSND